MNTEHAMKLVSHRLCPYVQRAAIALQEKGVPFERIDIDLADKPDWFLTISPLGKVPVLKDGNDTFFESVPILEYLEDTLHHPLHPADPRMRARHRAYLEFASQVLNGIGALYNAPDEATFGTKAQELRGKFEHLDSAIDPVGPYFAGSGFSLVDTAFGPVFRYFDIFDAIGDFGILTGLTQVNRWRRALAIRPSVRNAVPEAYPAELLAFLKKRKSWIAGLAETANKAG
ncbi:glutathione S-transferase family protein [Roseibium sp.]|uniref:glutathione S-transferase family protein n=1 Tax=Roseibium sp. TaxID=1936156 RepID=UPI003A97CFD2